MNQNVVDLMSNQLRTMIFEHIDNTTTYLSIGTFRALAYLVQECLYIVFNDIQDQQSVMDTFFQDVILYDNIVKITSGMANQDSKSIIDGKLNGLIYFIATCCIAFLLVYLIYFYPLLAIKISFLKKITRLLLIVPNPGSSGMAR